MCALLIACGLTLTPADPPAKKEPPCAVLTFSGDRTLDQWASTLELTTSSGAAYELTVKFGERGNRHLANATKDLLAANWIAEAVLDGQRLLVFGVRTADGKCDPVKSLTITNRLVNGRGRMPDLVAVGGAKVEVKAAEGEAPKPAPARKSRPTGPTIKGDTFVEIDVSTLPEGAPGVSWDLDWDIRTTAGKEEPNLQIPIGFTSDAAVGAIIDLLAGAMSDSSYKIEAVGETKLRVYGAVLGGRYYPAQSATVKSPHLKLEQLPKITNPKRG